MADEDAIWVPVLPDMSRWDSVVNRVAGRDSAAMRRAGEQAGKAYADGLTSSQRDVERAAATLTRARDREVAAANNVRAAEDRLNELRSSGAGDADQLATAEARLESARRRGDAAARMAARAQTDLAAAESRAAAAARGLAEDVGQANREMDHGTRSAGRFTGQLTMFGHQAKSTLRGIAVGFGMVSSTASSVVRNVGTAATMLGWAARITRSFSASLLVGATLLRTVAGTGLAKLAGALKLIAWVAGRVAREVARITSALLVLQAVGRLVGTLTRLGRAMGMVTVGAALAVGVFAGLSNIVSGFATGPLAQGLLAVGAAAGTAAAAAGGILGPALVAAKIGFAALGDASKEFMSQFSEADKAFNLSLGEKLGPALIAFRDLKQEIGASLVDGLGGAVPIASRLLGQLQPRMGVLSETMGRIGTQVAKSLAGPEAMAGWDRMLSGSNAFFRSLSAGENGLGSVASGLVSVLGTAAQTFSGAGAGINDFLLNLGERLRSITAEDLRGSFETLRTAFESVTSVAGPILTAFRELGGVSANALGPGFVSVGQAIAQATPGLVQMAETLMPALGQALTNLAPVLPGLVEAFTPWSEVLAAVAPHLATIIADLTPFAPVLLGVAMAVKVVGVGLTLWNAAMAVASVVQGVFIAATGRSTAAIATNAIAMAAHRATLVAISVATRAWAAVQWALNAALFANPIVLIVLAVIALIAAIVLIATKTTWFQTAWEYTWNAVKAAWDWVWNALKAGFDAFIGFFTDTIPNAVGRAKDWVVQKWNEFLTGWSILWGMLKAKLGEFISFFTETIPNAVGQAKDWVVNKFGELVGFLGSLPGRVGAALGGLWDSLKGGFRDAINFIVDAWNNFSLNFDFTIPVIDKKVSFSIDTPNLPRLRTGGVAGRDGDGMLWGPGTGTSDSILGMGANGVPTALVSAGEFVVNAESTRKFLPLLQALNAGSLPRLADGGPVSTDKLVDFAKGVEGKPYVWGGVNWGDCSGAVSAIANFATGRDPFSSRFATASEKSELEKRGFKPGLGPAGSLNIGWYNGGPGGGHTSATLPNGVNFEMGGARGDGQYGGGAAGADHSQYTDHAHLPPEHFGGLDGGAPTTGSSGALSSSSLSGSGGSSGGGGASIGGGTSSFGNSGGSSKFNSAGAAKRGGLTAVWVENWPGGMGGGSTSSSSTSSGASTSTSSGSTSTGADSAARSAERATRASDRVADARKREADATDRVRTAELSLEEARTAKKPSATRIEKAEIALRKAERNAEDSKRRLEVAEREAKLASAKASEAKGALTANPVSGTTGKGPGVGAADAGVKFLTGVDMAAVRDHQRATEPYSPGSWFDDPAASALDAVFEVLGLGDLLKGEDVIGDRESRYGVAGAAHSAPVKDSRDGQGGGPVAQKVVGTEVHGDVHVTDYEGFRERQERDEKAALAKGGM
ncbi:tail length tape measure protein [Gordonia phage Catfish]|uniref:Tape measure protein n=1 Tax=Gordonia phage Catfish TaxID=2301538 RepID=A0A385D2D9_9CAUD|nr:tail length tape measure protein [Gordonia phage Catfish]AXQ51857.1 tape measure protein [Gordonia phage Catfish]